PCTLILGMMRDKDCAAICKILAAQTHQIFLVPVDSERTADPVALAEYCREANSCVPITVCRSLVDAFTRAASEPQVAVTGSLYLVGQALEYLGLAAASSERQLNENASGPTI
ncbi:MAG TPA: hypothetical protein VFC44_17995, partial [Candidatus Saccharimonadales bacterium]|nr:hypothetical protein [Candidatus Saccharimonadales bacterium]